MARSFESVSESLWTAADRQLFGKQHGTRVLVWVNFDLISLQKIFYILEKGFGRVVLRDFPIPVLWDEELPAATARFHALLHAIDNFTFADLPPFAISSVEDDDWETWGKEDEDEEEKSVSFVESLATEDTFSSMDDSDGEYDDEEHKDIDRLTEDEAVARIRQQFSFYLDDDNKNDFE